jgi:hypothetical protein
LATYLDLVNMTIDETNLDLAQLTSSNFANPPDRMFTRLKKWVREAESQMRKERPDSYALTKTGVALVSPRFSFYDYNDVVPTTLPQGDAQSAETDVTFTTGPALFTSTTEGYSDITAFNGNPVNIENPINFDFRVGEMILYPDDNTPNAVTRFKEWGTYNFVDQSAPLDTPNTDVDYIHKTSMEVTVDSTNQVGWTPMKYVPHSAFPLHECLYGTAGVPRQYTQLPNGRWAFWPRPAYPVRVRFRYSAKEPDLTNWDDVPEWLDPRWHQGIVYLAAHYYGSYENPQVAQRAFKRYWDTKQQMERELNPEPSFRPIRMW